MTPDEALGYLQSFPDGERGTADNEEIYTLERMKRLLELLDHPETAAPIVHVVGTKGKGSTAAMIASGLHGAGYRAGLYISPHLVDYRERVRIDGHLIPPMALAAIVDERVRPAVEQLRAAGERIPLHFELFTALAFEHFRRERVDVAVIEAGLGGRLDATNAVAETALTVITTIGHDHMAILGETLERIAAEKAAVVRPAVPVVSAPQVAEAAHVIDDVCRERHAPLWTIGREWSLPVHVDEQRDATTFDVQGPDVRFERLTVPLAGAHQAVNGATAVAALMRLRERFPRLNEVTIRRGLAATRWPGRLQTVAQDPLIILDAAHNRESAAMLAGAMARLYPERPLILVVAMFRDKDAVDVLGPLVPLASHVVVTATNHLRARSAAELAATVGALGGVAEQAPTVAAALERARTLAGSTGRVLVTGSVRTVGEAMAALGIGDDE